ncbi:MAG: ribulose-phosphate 3-epimerase [candidate division Zixibacteria bacterium]|nr:ribulose-phosphate 3-epimerase [candidate division Zixibacteria bacterium]
MVKIASSLLAADFAHLGDEIRTVQSAGADMVHLDIMDGHFVPNISFGPAVAALSKLISPLPHDAHLMVTEPENYIESFAKTGVEYIIFHIEIEGIKKDLGAGKWVYVADNIRHPQRIKNVIERIKKAGCKAGLTLNPPTKMEVAYPYLKEVDLLLLMSVNPGFAGQKFIPEVYEKIPAAAHHRQENKLNFEIMIDGGVGLDNARELIKSGADILVAGSSFFGSSDRTSFIHQMKS